MQQAVDAAEVHERAVVGEVLDDALEHRALDQLLEQLLALFRMLALDHRTAGDDDVVALAVELDELELEFLAFQVHRVADRAHVDQRTGQECADVLDVDGEAALDLAADAAGDGFVGFSSASSSSSHTMARLAFSRDSTVSPKPFSSESSATLTSSPTPTSISPASLRNCSIGTMPSDFRPALITTTSVADLDDDAGDDGAGLELGQVGLALFEQFGK